MTRRKIYEWLAWSGISMAGFLLIETTEGIATFALTTLVVLAFLTALRRTIELIAAYFDSAPRLGLLRKLTLACLSLMLGLLLFEGFLAVMAGMQKPAQGGGGTRAALTMPDEWKIRTVEIQGATRAFYSHNVLHVFNYDDMRLVGEFGPNRPDTFRVMVVGDSLTYGQGVPSELSYCGVLEKELGAKYCIEVLNLGRCGDQSEDVLRIVKKYLPKLKPDMVIYGVCLNDFLPSGKGEYENNLSWSISFPLQQHFTEKTRVGGFLAKKYDDLLIALGARADFFTDILRDFDGYQRRFARDVKQINDVVLAAGLPAVTTLVLTQFPGNVQGGQLAAIAEKLLAEAGMQVVPSKGYIEKNAGKMLTVSSWEGHPSAACHALFAEQLRPYIERTPGLEKYRRVGPESPTF